MRMELREFAHVPNVKGEKEMGMKNDPSCQPEQCDVVGREGSSGHIKLRCFSDFQIEGPISTGHTSLALRDVVLTGNINLAHSWVSDAFVEQ